MQSDYEKLEGDMQRVMGTASRDSAETLYGRIKELEHELAIREARLVMLPRYEWSMDDDALRFMLWIVAIAFGITALAFLVAGLMAASGVPVAYALKSFGIFEAFVSALTLFCLVIPAAIGLRRKAIEPKS